MRTTLTIDDDVAALIEIERRRSGEPLKGLINRMLRSGLTQHTRAARPAKFTVYPHSLQLPVEWTSGSIQELIEMVEGPGSR